MADKVQLLERDTSALLLRARSAEDAGTAGRERAAFQRDARKLQERGTLLLIQIDAMAVGDCKQSRDAIRKERKRLTMRIDSCSTSLSPFL